MAGFGVAAAFGMAGFGGCVDAAGASRVDTRPAPMTADDGAHEPNAYFRNRYRIESARLRGYDYTAAGMYHIVVCTARRVRWFGEVEGRAVVLSPAGRILRDELARTPAVRHCVDIDAWVIMPDHLHVILALSGQAPAVPRDGPYMAPGSVGAIINQIKGACTKRIRAAGAGHFAWQPRFFDRIIRSQRQLDNTRRYIAHNPAQWDPMST